jgi:hypothetical protein
VLEAVEQHRATMVTLPDPPDTDEAVTPWNVREVILGIGVNAARELGSWQQALDFNRAIQESKRNRDAGEADLAGTAFNDYGVLLALGHNEKARDLLTQCRRAFEADHNYPMLAKTLVAMADVEGRLGDLDGAISLGQDALRLAYVVVDPEAIAVGHHNLATHLAQTDADLRTILANLLTAALIRYQTGSGDLVTSVQAVAGMLPDGQQEIGRLSFDDVCSIVDSGEGIQFAALFARLPARARTGQDAVTDVLRLASDLRSDVIAQTLDVWDPIVSALLAVRHDSADLTVEDVDQVLSAIVRRTLGALAGTVDIDPNAWRVLVEQA